MKFFLKITLISLNILISLSGYAQSSAAEPEQVAAYKQIISDQLPAEMRQFDFDIQPGNSSEFTASFYSKQCLSAPNLSSFLPHELYHLKKQPHGFTIQLHPDLYTALASNPQQDRPSCWLSVTSNLALAALFEALLQFYDDLGLSPEDQSLRFNICDQANNTPADLGTTRAYQRLTDRRKRYSDKDIFVQLGNFNHKPMAKADLTQLAMAQDPQTALLFSYASFHLDPQFYCQWPAHWQWINHTFYAGSKQPPQCANHLEQSFLDRTGTAQFSADRVWKIEFLQAAPGHAELISRFGHVMLGVIACAPEHAVPGPECEQDTQYHYILTFGGEHVANLWQGLTSVGDARLFVRDYGVFIDGYTQEHRDVKHLPLNLTMAEKTQLLAAAFERTKFFIRPWNDLNNNCVNNTFSLLRAAVPNLESETYTFETPKQMGSWVQSWNSRAP